MSDSPFEVGFPSGYCEDPKKLNCLHCQASTKMSVPVSEDGFEMKEGVWGESLRLTAGAAMAALVLPGPFPVVLLAIFREYCEEHRDGGGRPRNLSRRPFSSLACSFHTLHLGPKVSHLSVASLCRASKPKRTRKSTFWLCVLVFSLSLLSGCPCLTITCLVSSGRSPSHIHWHLLKIGSAFSSAS